MTYRSTGHYLKNGLYCAHASNASYSARPANTNSGRFVGLDGGQLDRIDVGSEFAYVAELEDQIIVAIQGTDDGTDWWKNIDVSKSSQLSGSVHSGFWEGLRALFPEIEESLKTRVESDKSVVVTGHS